MHIWKTSFIASYRTFCFYVWDRDTLIRALKVALVVGTIVGLINHGPALLAGHFTPDQLVPFFITYFVPFTVSTYSQIQAKRQRDRVHTKEAHNPSVAS